MTVNGGKLGVQGGFSVSRPISVGERGGEIETKSGGGIALLGGLTGSGKLVKSGTGELRLRGAAAYTGVLSLREGTVVNDSGTTSPLALARLEFETVLPGKKQEYLAHVNDTLGGLAGPSGRVTAQMSLTIDQKTSGTFGGSLDFLSGGTQGSLFKKGTGDLVLTGLMTNVGNVQVENGLLELSRPGGLQLSEVRIEENGRLIKSNGSLSVSQLSGGGDIEVLSGDLTVSSSAFGGPPPPVFSGAVIGTSKLIFAGSNWQFEGTVSPIMKVQVDSGTFLLPKGLNAGSSYLEIQSSATLRAKGTVERLVVSAGELEAIGDLVIGSPADPSGFSSSGQLKVGSHFVRLQSADRAVLSGEVQMESEAILDSTNGILLTGTLTSAGQTEVRGAFRNGGNVSASGPLRFEGSVDGPGSFSGSVIFAGGYSPGASPAVVDFDGPVTFEDFATLAMEIFGSQPGAGYDQLRVAGEMTLSGTLRVILGNGFAPDLAETFRIFDAAEISGEFSKIQLPALPGGLDWDVTSLYSEGVISVIPEPQALGLLGAAALAWLIAGRSRSRSAGGAKPGRSRVRRRWHYLR